MWGEWKAYNGPMSCPGKFSEAERQQICDEHKNDPSALLIRRCPLCGTSVVAENKGGEWVPEAHNPPSQRVYKGAGRKRGVGKALIIRGKASPSRLKIGKKRAPKRVYRKSGYKT